MSTTISRLPPIHPGHPPNATVAVELCIVAETSKAIQCTPPDAPGEKFWLPRSQVSYRETGEWTYAKVYQVKLKAWLYQKINPPAPVGGKS